MNDCMDIDLIDQYIDRLQVFLDEEWNGGVREQARSCLLDYTAVLLAGARQLRERHETYLAALGIEGGPALVAGIGKRADIYSAALLNGLSAHVLELDDGHRYGMLHPSVPVISALLAIAEQEKMTAEDFLKSIAVGYEATIRLACMVQPVHKKRGFHASATCGTVGAALAVGIARGYDRERLKSTASAAMTSASGLLAMIDDDSELKPYNCAQAAVNGLMAANIALCGYRSPDDALGGPRGFICALNGARNTERETEALQMHDCMGTCYRKMYASCRHTHCAVEAALRLREKHALERSDIQKVQVKTYDMAVYGHDAKVVGSIAAAKMSTPYSVAVALLYGKSGLDAFTDELLGDPAVVSLMKRVEVVDDDELSALAPGKRVAVVTVTDAEGHGHAERVDYPKGEPENPLTEEEQANKFRALLCYADRSPEQADVLLAYVQQLEGKLKEYLKEVIGDN